MKHTDKNQIMESTAVFWLHVITTSNSFIVLLAFIFFPVIAGVPCRQFNQVENGCYAIKNNYMILSNHTVHSVLECSELCSWQSLCIAFYHRDIPNEINCQLTNYTKEYLQRSFCDGEWTLFQDANIPATLPVCYKIYSLDVEKQQQPSNVGRFPSSNISPSHVNNSNSQNLNTSQALNNSYTQHSNHSHNFKNVTQNSNHSQTFDNYTENSSDTLERYSSCADLFSKGKTSSGVYTIEPDDFGSFDVFCDMTNSGGGWTVFQKRYEGTVDFYQDWNNYSTGFGNLSGEFWLGLEKIHRLTKIKNVTLHIDLEDFEGVSIYAEYDLFMVEDVSTNFKLTVGYFEGTRNTLDGLFYHNGMEFSTKDKDNDITVVGHCAKLHKGGWWYKHCMNSNLNGIYYQHGTPADGNSGIMWTPWKGSFESLKATEMKIRPRSFRETSSDD